MTNYSDYEGHIAAKFPNKGLVYLGLILIAWLRRISCHWSLSAKIQAPSCKP